MPSTLPILIADDDAAVRSALKLLLKGEGLACEAVASPLEAKAALKQRDYACALVDLNYQRDTTSGAEGLALVAELRELDPLLPILVMTAWGSIPLAVQALHLGASDFLEKPWNNQRLLSQLRTLMALAGSRRQGQRLAAESARQQADALRPWLGASPAMQSLMAQVARVAPSAAPLLILGENGSGKSQLARAIHAQSACSDGPFVSVNMGAIPETLFESEMFGHEKGAFTDAKQARLGRFELAEGGSLFLDEIGTIPLAQQAKLLQVLESGQFERLGSGRPHQARVRLIAASNAPLEQMVRQGLFRQDLLYRINTVVLRVPALRERPEDIPALAEHFIAAHAERYRQPLKTLSAAALQALLAHDWPGNVRELSHCMERACLLGTGDFIAAQDLALPAAASAQPGIAAAGTDIADLSALSLEEAERLLIQTALRRSGGNALQAAQALGLSRSAFYRRLEKYGL